jgi:hypothetical protein
MNEDAYLKEVDRQEAIELNHLRDLQFRANELGVAVYQRDGLDAMAIELSRMIDELNG